MTSISQYPVKTLAEIGVQVLDCEHKTPKFQSYGHPYIAIPNIRDGRIDFADAARISDGDLAEWTRRTRPQGGDLVITRRGRVGDSAPIPADLPCAIGQNLVILRSNGVEVDQGYLRWAMRGPRHQAQVDKWLNVGAVFDSLNVRDLPRFEIPVPSLPEQRAIAHVLGTLDDKIELNRQMNQTLAQIAAALFRSWFIDFDPVRAKMAGREPEGMDAATAALFPERLVASELGEIPEGWKYKPLGDALEVIETGSRPRGGVKGILSGIPSVGAESISGLAKFDFSKTKFIPDQFFNSMKSGVIQDKDVLLYKDGGKPGNFEPHVAMFGSGFPFDAFAINEHVYRLRAACPVTQEFLYFWLNTDLAMEEMRRRGTGVAIPGLNSTAAKSISILIPDDRILQAITTILSPIVEKALTNSLQAKTIAELRDALLPRLLSGELRVPTDSRVTTA